MTFFLFINGQTSEAASYGSWKSIPGYAGCKVRVVTDYSTYTETATTIDAYAQSSGCPKFYYKMNISNPSHEKAGTSKTGYFSSQTPTKSFYLNNFNQVPGNKGKNIVFATIDLYSDSKYNNLVDVVWSNELTVYR